MISHRISGSTHSSRRSLKPTVWLAVLLAGSALPLFSQQSPHPAEAPPPPPPPPPVFVNEPADYGPPPLHSPTFQEKQYLRYLESRLNSAASDADKLLKLAKELNRESDPSKAGTTSLEDLQTVAKIEKLARNVKWNMKFVVEAAPAH